MKYFPVFLDLADQPVLVVGGGEAAAQKLRLLRKTPARLRVIAPDPNPEIAALARDGQVDLARRPFRRRDLRGARLVYAATGDRAQDRAVARAAHAAGIPVNVVDDPALCSFITPAIVDRDPVTVAIGTEGAAPVLARRLKTAIEGLLPADLGRVARFAAALRPAVAARLPDGAARRRFWARFFDGPAQAHLLAGDVAKAHDAVERAFGNGGANETERGSVALVGAGPGDPDLLTLKAVRALQAADVVVYDRLVNPRVLELARRDAARIAVGKSPGGPSVPQSEIDALLVDQARAGRRVVRLKGGDPLVFGRAAEELAALRAAGVPVEVVPGITAAAGCAAAIALPLTTRERTRGLTLLTGSAVDGPAEHDWADLARPGRAFAVYMGVRTAGHIERRLRAAGIDPATPVTVVENGTRPEQRVIDGRIDGLADLIDAHRVRGPAIIFVGLARGEAVAATARVVPFPAPDARPERIAV